MIQGQAWVIRFGTSTYMGAIRPLGQQYSKPLNHEKKRLHHQSKVGETCICKADAVKSCKRPSSLHVSMRDWWSLAIFGDLFPRV